MKAYQLKIMLKHTHPPIWRRVLVPAGLSFSQLSLVLNEAMGWEGGHLSAFEFYYQGLRFEEEPEDIFPDEYDVLDSAEYMIEPFLDEEEWFSYIYDFGDHWDHRVTIERIVPDYEHSYPMVIKYKGDTPYEDCGGVQGYYDLQEKLSNPADPEYARLKAWTEQHAHVEYNLKQVNENLARMALGRKKSRPMTQEEIWHEVWEKGLPFKQIQGFREIRDPFSDEEDDEYWTHMAGLAQDLQNFLRETELQWLPKKPEETRLVDILGSYNKTDLVEIARIHSLNGYSRFNKDALTDFVCREILSGGVMRRYFVYLEDEELAVLEKGPKKAGGYVLDWPYDLTYFLAGGYCGAIAEDRCHIPGEVWEACRKNCTAEWKAKRAELRELLDYLNAAAQLNGCCTLDTVLQMYEKNTGRSRGKMEIWQLYAEMPETKRIFELSDELVILRGFEEESSLKTLSSVQKGKEVYLPDAQEVYTLGRKGYLPFDRHMRKLEDFIGQLGAEPEAAEGLCRLIQEIIRVGGDMQEIVDVIGEEYLELDEPQTKRLVVLLQQVWNNTRMISNCGHTPIELSGRAGKVIAFPVKKAGKIYPNDPCPCGSGKKYKNCCGKGGGK